MNLFDGGRLKGDDIPNVDHFAVENIRFVIKLDVPNIAFVRHHGLIPASDWRVWGIKTLSVRKNFTQ